MSTFCLGIVAARNRIGEEVVHRTRARWWVEMSFVMALLLAASLQARPAWDVPLVSTSGAEVWLSSWVDRPVLLFYEDRGGRNMNRSLKEELSTRRGELGLEKRIRVLAIADLGAWSWFPAREAALRAVREAERELETPILIDWDRALGAPPWALPTGTSSVLLVDADGSVLFRRSGELSAGEREELLGLLETLARP